jgi:hypothetical protein
VVKTGSQYPLFVADRKAKPRQASSLVLIPEFKQ